MTSTDTDGRRLFGELTRLLAERAQLEATIARLADPWADVRHVLNDLHRLLLDPTPLEARRTPGAGCRL